ncbi:MAG: hypothetical protein ACFN4S_06890, partial [Prevotella conceptionensis]
LCLLFFCLHGRVYYVKKRKMNVFVKPNEQCRACSDIVMARKRTFRGTRKERGMTESVGHAFSDSAVLPMGIL